MKGLILARQGFGKSSSLVGIPEVGIEGLDPKTTYLFSVTNKPLPRAGSKKLFVSVPMDVVTEKNIGDHITKGNRIISNDAKIIAAGVKLLIDGFGKHPYTTIVIDDTNYLQQDFYMKNALKGGWDTPKQIGYNMHLIFEQVDRVPEGMHLFMLAHYDAYKDKGGDEMIYKYKSTGAMVDEYITPEGKFETVLFGKIETDPKTKEIRRVFVTNHDGTYPAKSPYGLFQDKYIPNDLGYVLKRGIAYENGEE